MDEDELDFYDELWPNGFWHDSDFDEDEELEEEEDDIDEDESI